MQDSERSSTVIKQSCSTGAEVELEGTETISLRVRRARKSRSWFRVRVSAPLGSTIEALPPGCFHENPIRQGDKSRAQADFSGKLHRFVVQVSSDDQAVLLRFTGIVPPASQVHPKLCFSVEHLS